MKMTVTAKEELIYLLKAHIPISNAQKHEYKKEPQYKMLEKWRSRNKDTYIDIINDVIAESKDLNKSVLRLGVDWMVETIDKNPDKIKITPNALLSLNIFNSLKNNLIKRNSESLNMYIRLIHQLIPKVKNNKEGEKIISESLKLITRLTKTIDRNNEKGIKSGIDETSISNLTHSLLNHEYIKANPVKKELFISDLSNDRQDMYYASIKKTLNNNELVENEIYMFNFLLKRSMTSNIKTQKIESKRFELFLSKMETVEQTDKWKDKITWPYRQNISNLYKDRINSIYMAFENKKNKDEIYKNLMPLKSPMSKLISNISIISFSKRSDVFKLLNDYFDIDLSQLYYGDDLKETMAQCVYSNILSDFMFPGSGNKINIIEKWEELIKEMKGKKININLLKNTKAINKLTIPVNEQNESRIIRSVKSKNSLDFIGLPEYDKLLNKIPDNGIQTIKMWQEWLEHKKVGHYNKAVEIKIPPENKLLEKEMGEFLILLNKNNLYFEIHKNNLKVKKTTKRKF